MLLFVELNPYKGIHVPSLQVESDSPPFEFSLSPHHFVTTFDCPSASTNIINATGGN